MDAVLLDADIRVVDAVRQDVVRLLRKARQREREQERDVTAEQFRQQGPSPADDRPEDRDSHQPVNEAVERRPPLLDAADEFDRDEERVDHEAEARVGQQVEEQVEPLQQRDGRRLQRFLPRPEQKEQDKEVVGHDVAREPVPEGVPVEDPAPFEAQVDDETDRGGQEHERREKRLHPQGHAEDLVDLNASRRQEDDQQERQRPLVGGDGDGHDQGRHQHVLDDDGDPVEEFLPLAVHPRQVSVEVEEHLERRHDEREVPHGDEQLWEVRHLRIHGRLQDGRDHEDHVSEEEQRFRQLLSIQFLHGHTSFSDVGCLVSLFWRLPDLSAFSGSRP